mgnify:CR=1 FL=1
MVEVGKELLFRVMEVFWHNLSCNNIITFIEDDNQILKCLNVLRPVKPLGSIEEVVTRVLGVPLDKEGNRDLPEEAFLNEPSTENLENIIVFVLTAAIVKSGNEMATCSLGWVQ